MEIKILKGNLRPIMTWVLFIWKYFIRELKGSFSIDINLWSYGGSRSAHQLFAKKDYFSDNGSGLFFVSDKNHVGRYLLYSFTQRGDVKISEYITHLYNDRKYEFSITKETHGWNVMVDDKYIKIKSGRPPFFTYNDLPKINASAVVTRDVVITYEHV